jgi:hypothetical protein
MIRKHARMRARWNRQNSWIIWGFLVTVFLACGLGGGDPSIVRPENQDTLGIALPPSTDTTGLCSGICDASPPSHPILDSALSFGDITTYGSVSEPAPSQGGACNYGETEVFAFAAINVHALTNDFQGQWDGGRVCGQCFEVSLRSDAGWKTTVVRIMDKCPDEHCGIDLGGTPAKALMGEKPGRYSGKWRSVICPQLEGLFDGPPSLFIKEGSNPFWALAQVRNAVECIVAVRMRIANAEESEPWMDKNHF